MSLLRDVSDATAVVLAVLLTIQYARGWRLRISWHRREDPATVTTCGSCHAEILWAPTATGRRMPLDRTPDPDGNVVLLDDRAVVLSPEARDQLPTETPRYRSHFASCPNANTHRKAEPKPDPAVPTLF